MKSLKLLLTSTLTSLAVSSIALTQEVKNLPNSCKLVEDTLKCNQSNALRKAVDLDVTPMGLVIDFGSQISSVSISHKSHIVYSGFDGALCARNSQCNEPPPTKLNVRKIPEIKEMDEESMPQNRSLLSVDTESGLYQFKFKPVTGNPQYTKVEIGNTVNSSYSRYGVF